jgi:hypothetical protein
MPNAIAIRRAIPLMLLAGGLTLDLLLIRAQVEAAIGAAACFERANYYLILCAEAPSAWQFAMTVALGIAFAGAIGARLPVRT